MDRIPGSAPLTLGQHQLQLLHQHAVWWPAEATLLVADLHLGKGASFRKLGQPVPAGSSALTLERLAQLLGLTHAQRVIVLGDFWHHAHAIDDALMEQVRAWLHQHAQADIRLLLGNHDRATEQRNSALGLRCLHAPHPLAEQLIGLHEPLSPSRLRQRAPVQHIAGHLHPGITLPDPAGGSVAVPAFVWQPGQLIMPAFGAFTGCMTLPRAAPGQRIAIAAPDRVIWLPGRIGNVRHGST